MNVLLQGVVGSTAYGLAREGSDVDRLGVFVAPTVEFLGLSQPKDTYVTNNPDVTLHEIGKYVSLALKCNPTILELLWLPQDLVELCTDEGVGLRALRLKFLSEKYVRDAFGGYAVQQARRLERRNAEGNPTFSADTGKRTAKHARHCFRLLAQGQQLLTTGTMDVRVTDPAPYWEFDDMSVEEIVYRFERAFKKFNESPSVLPEHPDRERVERFLLWVRERY